MSGKTRPSDLKPLKSNDINNGLGTFPIEKEKNENEDLGRIGITNGDNIYSRFSKHVKDNKVQRDDFCRPIHIFIT